MAEFHFVEDYERHVADLVAKYPIDEAMSLAVGGQYERIGDIASDIVIHAGARDGMSVFDFGCGSGRVASALSHKIDVSDYLGTDIVQALLDYAATKTPDHFEFRLHRVLNVPAEDARFDIAYAFSVFTHLLQTECYLYLKDIARTVRPGGTIVASFLEFSAPAHWPVFEASLKAPHLNTFIERNQWNVWTTHIGLETVEFIDGHKAVSDKGTLGQSVVIFRKPR